MASRHRRGGGPRHQGPIQVPLRRLPGRAPMRRARRRVPGRPVPARRHRAGGGPSARHAGGTSGGPLMLEPAWWQRGAIYQIYPRSFADSDGDGVGDLPGIAAHLDYLSELGVEALWLSPIQPSPMVDFGYDVADYCQVDPTFGTLADLDRLIADCHARGIRLLLDWVPNHTSDRHPWFLASQWTRDDPKRDWYVWRDGRDGGPPNNGRSTFGRVGPAWSFDRRTGQWYLHSFTPQQPDLNWDNPAVEAAMHDGLRFWLDRGVDGFRIDVVHKIAKDPLLRDNTEAARRHDEDWDSIHDRIRAIRRVVDEYPDRMIVGEVYLLDLRRVASRFDDGGHGQARARAVALMLYALRGTPFIYQGEELGLPDADIPPERMLDVDGRDPERAPIPWRPPSVAGPGAGFTTGQPWLPLGSHAERLCVERQAADPRSTLSLVRGLAALRRKTPMLQTGAQRCLEAGADVLAWLREGDGERVLAAVNFATVAVPLRLDAELPRRARIALSTDPDRADGEVDLHDVALGPSEGIL